VCVLLACGASSCVDLLPHACCLVLSARWCAPSASSRAVVSPRYACSIFYRTQLPLVVCFNKTDVISHEFAVEWMKDYDAFVDALRSERDDSCALMAQWL
jgi:hypothetical protein